MKVRLIGVRITQFEDYQNIGPGPPLHPQSALEECTFLLPRQLNTILSSLSGLTGQSMVRQAHSMSRRP
jgi:hypothetical protein